MTIAGSLNGQPSRRCDVGGPVIREFIPISFRNPFTRENQHLTRVITIVRKLVNGRDPLVIQLKYFLDQD